MITPALTSEQSGPYPQGGPTGAALGTPEPGPATDDRTRLALTAARSGAPEDIARFVTAFAADVTRYLAFLHPDTDAVEDLAQETMLRAIVALRRFEGRSSARTWLFSIARRTVVDSVRRASARPRLADGEDWERQAEVRQAPGGQAVHGLDEAVALRALLGTLTEERRQAFVATQVWGLSYEHCASLSGCAVGTVRSRVSRARADLVRTLRDAERV
ncbi:sigma-70 family RNA polymerase sigma factor [Streptomyces sp. XM4011]|uniref:sigma-70 family RNA polymerase sigma factor n=1 Tax=Streptomyces TaxID=1883 RepID=UPI001FF96D3A|nr:sigma-70 family RNA polymerase sigma factor [Streptomyces sp. XM4011]MCK1817330.1 sigma-70 family RNA polymerase sigma factor [Streptomyces sp. XM4011]